MFEHLAGVSGEVTARITSGSAANEGLTVDVQ